METTLEKLMPYRGRYKLTIQFSDVTNREHLGSLIKKLFLENSHKLFNDYFEGNNDGYWIGRYWGRTPKFFDGKVECYAKYGFRDAEVVLKMPKQQIINYLAGLNKVPGINLPEDQLEQILDLE